MGLRTHPAAVRYALEQELSGSSETLYNDDNHRLAFQDRRKRYLGSVKRGERVVHYWWVSADEELLTIDEGPNGVIVSGNLDNPVNSITRKEMTLEELEQSGDFDMPPPILRDLENMSELGASVMGPMEYRACDVLLPLLGVKVIPEKDAEYVKHEIVNWGKVRFYRSSRKQL